MSGVIGIELFERDDGRLLVNEFAPRVHNTGHWTLDGCEVDQFEQHIRAIAGWPLGPTHAIARVEMTNLIGEEANDWTRLAAEPETRLWLYGKTRGAPRPQDGPRQPAHPAAVMCARCATISEQERRDRLTRRQPRPFRPPRRSPSSCSCTR